MTTRYIYRGPYTMVEILDAGVKKEAIMGQPIDITDVALIEDQNRRGMQIFELAEGETLPSSLEPPAPEPPVETPPVEEAPPA